MIPEKIIQSYAVKYKVNTENSILLFNDLELFLESASQQEISTPTIRIDNAWHHFILFTEEYFNYCNSKFNRIIHHRPKVGMVLQESNNAKCVSKCDSQDSKCEAKATVGDCDAGHH